MKFCNTTSTRPTAAICNRRAELVTPESCVHCFWNPQHSHLRAAYRTSKACAAANITLTTIEPAPDPQEAQDDVFAALLDRLSSVAATMRQEGHSHAEMVAFGRGLVLLLGLDKE